MAAPRVAVVTGANKGIGLAIVRSLALTYPTSHLALNALRQQHLASLSSSSSPSSSATQFQSPTPPPSLLIYLTARDLSRGESALQSLLEGDELLRTSKVLKRDGGVVDVRFRRLDVGEREGVDEFVEWIGQEHEEGMSVLVNNAGVWEGEGIDPTTTSTTLGTNYHAPLSLSLRLLPHLRHSAAQTPGFNPRIVNISSLTSKLRTPKFSHSIIRAFRAAIANRSVADVTALMDGFEESVVAACEGVDGTEERKKKLEEMGWPPSPYAVSKAGLTAVSMIMGREELRRSASGASSSPTFATRSRRSSVSAVTAPRGASSTAGTEEKGLPILINAVCPGYVKTDMTMGKGRKTVEQGAELPVKLALEDIDGVAGEFWERDGVSVWDDGAELIDNDVE